MNVRVLCSNPSCLQEYRIRLELLGKSGKCKACGTMFVARNADDPVPAAREVSMSMLKDEPPPAPKSSAPELITCPALNAMNFDAFADISGSVFVG